MNYRALKVIVSLFAQEKIGKVEPKYKLIIRKITSCLNQQTVDQLLMELAQN